MKRVLLSALALTVAACAALPTKPLPSLEQLVHDPALETYVTTRGHRLGQPASVQLTRDGKTALFLLSGPRSDVRELHALDLATGADKVLATAATLLGGAEVHLSREQAAQRERMRVTARGIASFELSHDGRFALVPLGDEISRVEVASGLSAALPVGSGGAFDPQLSPDDSLVAFVRAREVWVANTDGSGSARQLTHGSSATLSHGTAEFVAQEEMDRFHGTFWSPDSQSLAVQETDESGVEVFTLADPAHGWQAPEASPYPRPGHPNAIVRLGVISIRGGPMTWIKWDRERFPYLARVHWVAPAPAMAPAPVPAGPLVIEVMTRAQRDLTLLRVDPASGATRALLNEHDDAWVELTNDFSELSTGGFLWSSERSGQRKLELHGADGALEKVLTNDAAGFRSLVGVDEAAQVALIAAGTDATSQLIAAVSLQGGPLRTVAEGDGPATAVASRDGRLLWLRQDHVAALPEQSLIQSSGTQLARLPSAMEPIARLPRPRFLTLDLPQGRLNAAVLLPSWAKAGQRFPVIDWVYGGPTVTTVARSALSFDLQQWFADQGFAVVKIDNRGTPHRGRAFARAIAGSFADVPLGDQADALVALAAQEPALDLQHVGIIGASFGGYLSALAVLKRPDRFQAGVALAPVTDWLEYDTTYTERYLGLPAENPRGYEESSLLGYAKALRRPLLLGHGTADDNVHFGHTLELIAALEQAGHAPSVFLIPGQTHLFADRTTQEVLWANAARFLLEELKR